MDLKTAKLHTTPPTQPFTDEELKKLDTFYKNDQKNLQKTIKNDDSDDDINNSAVTDKLTKDIEQVEINLKGGEEEGETTKKMSTKKNKKVTTFGERIESFMQSKPALKGIANRIDFKEMKLKPKSKDDIIYEKKIEKILNTQTHLPVVQFDEEGDVPYEKDPECNGFLIISNHYYQLIISIKY
jgi:hypothetical protein